MTADLRFLKRLAAARSQAQVFECVKHATKSPSASNVEALIECLHLSNEHRRTISRCLIKRIRGRAVAPLRESLTGLQPEQKIHNLSLLCRIGDPGAAARLVEAYCENIDPSRQLKRRASETLDSYADEGHEKLLELVTTGEDELAAVFAAPWCMKRASGRVCEALLRIFADTGANETVRAQALQIAARRAPAAALSALAGLKADFDPHAVMSVLDAMRRMEGFAVDEDLLLSAFGEATGGVRIGLSVFLLNHKAPRTFVSMWLMEGLRELGTDDVSDERNTDALAKAAEELLRVVDADTLAALSPPYGSQKLRHFAERALNAANHPLGAELLIKQMEDAKSPNEMYAPMVRVLLRPDTARVLRLVLGTEHEGLRRRAEQILAPHYPGMSAGQVLTSLEAITAQEKGATSPPETESTRKTGVSLRIERDQALVTRVKAAEREVCQTCDRAMRSAAGAAYSEVHHVHPLGEGGADRENNVLCLCPLCHRLFHLGLIGVDRDLAIHAGAGWTEGVRPSLRLAKGRVTISADALRYHWITFFVARPGVRFSPDDDCLDE